MQIPLVLARAVCVHALRKAVRHRTFRRAAPPNLTISCDEMRNIHINQQYPMSQSPLDLLAYPEHNQVCMLLPTMWPQALREQHCTRHQRSPFRAKRRWSELSHAAAGGARSPHSSGLPFAHKAGRSSPPHRVSTLSTLG